MKFTEISGGMVCVFFATACASGPAVNDREATAAIRAAEEVGANKVPKASLHLQLAKEESERAQMLIAAGDQDQAASVLRRAEADAELAVALARAAAETGEADQASERVRQLKQNNP